MHISIAQETTAVISFILKMSNQWKSKITFPNKIKNAIIKDYYSSVPTYWGSRSKEVEKVDKEQRSRYILHK